MGDLVRWRRDLARRLEADRMRRERNRIFRDLQVRQESARSGPQPDTETARHPAPAPEHWTPRGEG